MAQADRNGGLEGKVFLITGSGRGLGAALARAAAQARARVVVNCRDDLAGAEAFALDLAKRTSSEVLVRRANVTDPEQVQGLVEATVKAFGRVDVLVNTVGSFSWKPLPEIDPAEWRSVLASNLDSVYLTCRQCLPHMRKHHWGRIINLGTVGAERSQGQPKASAYSAAKAAVVAFSKALSLEEARSGITVNVVSPGAILDDGRPGDRAAWAGTASLGDRVPVGRAGTPDDFVRAVLFFASPAADFVTGQVLSVSGGWQL